ncbi:MAG: hypothetical protein K5845_18680 [Filomicrobium sp.]|nr:hypothetical protein [Filomicrobium sp.]
MMIEAKVWREPWDVDRRLAEMDLSRAELLEVRNIARASAANATPFHPTNAAGTFAYQDGSWALRDRHVGERWSVDRSNGVEAIKNERLGLRVIFSNVDVACDDELKPKPRSPKGAGAERACMGNLFGSDLPEFAPAQSKSIATYYLMVDERGAVELTRPVVKGRTFSAYVERIYISDGNDMVTDIFSLDDGDRADDFDPQVARK